MDSKDDSGIDSDNISSTAVMPQVDESTQPSKQGQSTQIGTRNIRRTSELQKKIEKQREKNRRKEAIEEQPKRSFLIPRTRLNIPPKHTNTSVSLDAEQPLVAIVSDDSEEDEFAVPRLSKEAQREITEQLIKDGYNLDLDPDDEDLDLIPPRPFQERCGCCPSATWIPQKCAVQ